MYHLLIGIFLLMLFSCLFFTYYLGGSKDTWEDPVFSGIRMNFSNITAIIGLFLEFVQICSFSFNYKAVFTGSSQLLRMQYPIFPCTFSLIVSFTNKDMLHCRFLKESHSVLCFGLCLLWLFRHIYLWCPWEWLFILSTVGRARLRPRLLFNNINKKYPFRVCVFTFWFLITPHIYSILWFLVNTIYIPVIATMMEGVDCTFTTKTDTQVKSKRLSAVVVFTSS